MKDRMTSLRASLRNIRAIIRWKAMDWGGRYGARLNRRRLRGVTFIGITGSAGKTTTKDLSVAILSTHGPCQSNPQSINDNYGVERTILSATRRHRFCVVEVGAPKPGHLDRSVRALQPSISALTNVEREHYSAFGSAEAIAAEKGKLIAALRPDGTAVLNIDDPLVQSTGERYRGRIIWVGKSEGATLRVLEVRSRWPEPLILRIQYEGNEYEVRTQLHGVHLALPVLTALGIALAAGMALRDAIEALASVQPTEGRMQIDAGEDGVTFIRDDWKAPQWSFRAPLEFMRDATAVRKVVVIGSISDSAKSPSQRYPRAAREALECADLVVFVGAGALHVSKVKPAEDRALKAFVNARDAAQFLKAELRAGDLVLLKGTNKQDHLVRLLMDRRRPVVCWQADCNRNYFCTICSKLYDTQATAPETNAVSSVEPDAPASLSASAVPRVSGAFLIAGLGNWGEQYHDSPHNVGQRVLDALVHASGDDWQEQPEGLVSKVVIGGVAVTLLKPKVNINESGPAIQRFLARTDGGHGFIVIHDDMDLPLGQARSKRSGGDAGHKGMRSIIAAFGTDEIRRIRIGVRAPGDARRARDAVLDSFSADEESTLGRGVLQAEAALRKMITMELRQEDRVLEEH